MADRLSVFLDESGFTGNNLLDEAQPLFLMAAVAVGAEEAARIAAAVTTEYSLSARELKGSKLCRTARGQQAVLKILALLDRRFRYIVINKRYAAGCKIFEYIVEPAITDCVRIFFREHMHRFVADAIFRETQTDFREILLGLSTAIRERNPDKAIEALGPVPNPGQEASVLSILKELAANNRGDIVAEFERLKGLDQARWIMDLSTTALFSLLCTWAETGRPLDVCCDESKPLATFVPAFSARIGAESEEFELPFGYKRRLFALSNEIKMGKSDEVPGLQLADVVAAVAAVVHNDPLTDFGKKASPYLLDRIDQGSMFPGSRPFSPEELQRAGDLLVIVAKARTFGMSPCEKLQELIEKAQKLRAGLELGRAGDKA